MSLIQKSALLILLFPIMANQLFAQQRPRDLGVEIGILTPGAYNAITDVAGVTVGHTTLNVGDDIRTGATAIVPHQGNVFQQKVPAAIYIGNGFGKLAGYSQVEELGNIETPIVLTNTLNVANAMNAVISYVLKNNENVRSVNAIVGETNDGYLNDIRGRHVKEEHVLNAINSAKSGKVAEGNVGAGTGTVCFGYKGGIGTSSRKLPENFGGYTVGVLVQTNFGGTLEVNGVSMVKNLKGYPWGGPGLESADGSCMIVVATDAPLLPHNLKRLAKRAMLGLAKTGGIASNGSGDYVIAFSTANENYVAYETEETTETWNVLRNDDISYLFLATIEATEEAIINSLFAAETTIGRANHKIEALPVGDVLELLRTAGKLK